MIRIVAGAGAIALLALAVVLSILLIGSGGPSASATLSSALAAARQRSSFHVLYSRRVEGDEYRSSADVAATQGEQQVAVSGGWRVRILVVDDVAYMAGNEAGFVHYFGFPTAAARKAGSRWVSIPSSNPGYAPASRDALREPVLADLTPGGHLTETSSTRIDGKLAIGISGTGPPLRPDGAPSSLTLFVAKTGSRLPLGAALNDTQGDHETVTLSAWGERIALRAPHNSIAIVTLAH
jgi:hypothetical protein